MKTKDVIEHYKTQTAVARALNIRDSAVSQWGEFPPLLRQHQLEKLTGGKLKAEDPHSDPSMEAA